jgi:hypothetical protein
MKKLTYCFILLIIVSPFLSLSQDIITKKNGEDIDAKIMEVTQTEVKYKNFKNLEGPLFVISKNDLLMVRYENGTKDIFSDNNSKSFKSSDDMSYNGKKDAIAFYKGKKSGAGWTCATSIVLSPLFGLIPAVACSAAEPASDNLNCPDEKMMKDREYNEAYVKQAHKTKKKRIWSNYGIGSGIWLALILLL